MKLVATIARYLLGLIFVVFGLNGFLHFIKQPPPPSPVALQYLIALSSSRLLGVVFALELIAGLLLLANRFVPLALVILAPVLVNILLYHGLMDPGGIGAGAFATILWILVYLQVRSAFLPLFAAKTPEL
jgi:uncharacterized membrane protein YphA (DoxX/SURF4 family)